MIHKLVSLEEEGNLDRVIDTKDTEKMCAEIGVIYLPRIKDCQGFLAATRS